MTKEFCDRCSRELLRDDGNTFYFNRLVDPFGAKVALCQSCGEAWIENFHCFLEEVRHSIKCKCGVCKPWEKAL